MTSELVSQYGYAGLFWLLLGFPIPGETVLTFAGYLAYTGELKLAPAIAAACLGNLVGISIAYLLGRTAGKTLLSRYGPKIGLTEDKTRRARVWFQHLGRWTLPFCYFVPGMRDVLGLTAGITGLRYGPFALLAYLGGVAWPAGYIMLGYYLGEEWARDPVGTRHALEMAGMAIGGLILLLAGATAFRRRRQRCRNA
ncbi:MAG: DedA family protein [Pseudomonadota bacterium]